MAKEYSYEGVRKACSAGGEIDRTLNDLQSELKKLRLLINDCESLFHGKGRYCLAYKTYEDIYSLIGSTNSYNVWYNFGMWDAILKIKNMADQLKTNADQDEEEYNEEQSQLNEQDDNDSTWTHFYWRW